MENKNNNLIIVLFLAVIGISIVYSTYLTPPLAAVFFFYLFYPYKKNILVKRALMIVSLLLLIWVWLELKYILMPFVISLFLAYIFDPIIDKLEKKMSRGLAVAIFIICVLGVLSILLLYIIPNLISQIKNIINTVGENQDKIIKFIENKWEVLSESEFIDPNALTQKIQTATNDLLKQFLNIFSGISAIFKSIFNIIIIPVVSFYLLRDYDRIRNFILNKLSLGNKEKFERGYERFNKIFGNYIRGVLTDALIVGILTYIGLISFGIPYALVISIFTIFFTLLPYIGIWVSFGFGIFIVLTSGGGIKQIIIMAIIYFTVQIIEGSIIYPKVIGKMIGLHPVVIMMMLLVLAHFIGILGFVIGVPLTALFWYFLENKIDEEKDIEKNTKN